MPDMLDSRRVALAGLALGAAGAPGCSGVNCRLRAIDCLL